MHQQQDKIHIQQFKTMKETISVSIAQQAFTMDIDAHQLLSRYLEDIAKRIPEGESETLTDIEARIAEIFRERVPSPMMVIPIEVVENMINQIGSAETFGETTSSQQEDSAKDSTHHGADPSAVCYDSPRQFRRSRSNRSLAGVCGGLSDYFNIDATLIRVCFIFGLLAGFSTGLLYILLWLVVPEEQLKTRFNEWSKK